MTGLDLFSEPEVLRESARPAKVRRASRLGADFKVPEDWIDWAVTEERMSAAAARREAQQFVDYWCAVPGARGCKLDWRATWRNRVRAVMDRERRMAAPAPAINGQAAQVRSHLDEIRRREAYRNGSGG